MKSEYGKECCHPDSCRHPDCLLKHKGTASAQRVEYAAKVVSGEIEALSAHPAEVGSERLICCLCLRSVLHDNPPFRTTDEWARLDHLGHWHQRRCWRSRQRTRYAI